jgi:hypothetical protein
MDPQHINVDDLTEEGIELYAGILLLQDLLQSNLLSEDLRRRVTNLRNRWIGLLQRD